MASTNRSGHVTGGAGTGVGNWWRWLLDIPIEEPDVGEDNDKEILWEGGADDYVPFAQETLKPGNAPVSRRPGSNGPVTRRVSFASGTENNLRQRIGYNTLRPERSRHNRSATELYVSPWDPVYEGSDDAPRVSKKRSVVRVASRGKMICRPNPYAVELMGNNEW